MCGDNITASGQRKVPYLGLVFAVVTNVVLGQVLDATKVQIGEPLPSTDVLWIAEQVPGELPHEFTNGLAENA